MGIKKKDHINFTQKALCWDLNLELSCHDATVPTTKPTTTTSTSSYRHSWNKKKSFHSQTDRKPPAIKIRHPSQEKCLSGAFLHLNRVNTYIHRLS